MGSIDKRIYNGKIRYRVRIRLKGFPKETETFDRLADAKRWERETETKILEGRYFKSNEGKDKTLNNAIDRYLKNVLPLRPKSIYARTIHLKFWKKELGEYALIHITPALIAEKRDKLASEETFRETIRSPATVNRYMASLSHVFTYIIKEWGWLEISPFKRLSKFKESRGRVRFLSDQERQILLETCRKSPNKALYPITLICLATGARKMEINGMHWSNVDLERNRITLTDTKNDEIRILPFEDTVKNILQKLYDEKKPKPNDLVFPSRILPNVPIEIRKHWYLAIEEAKIENFRFHDLRHSTASYLAMNGASLADIAEILGHKTLSMVKRYTHLSESHTAKVLASMNQKIFGSTDQTVKKRANPNLKKRA